MLLLLHQLLPRLVLALVLVLVRPLAPPPMAATAGVATIPYTLLGTRTLHRPAAELARLQPCHRTMRARAVTLLLQTSYPVPASIARYTLIPRSSSFHAQLPLPTVIPLAPTHPIQICGDLHQLTQTAKLLRYLAGNPENRAMVMAVRRPGLACHQMDLQEVEPRSMPDLNPVLQAKLPFTVQAYTPVVWTSILHLGRCTMCISMGALGQRMVIT